MAKLKKGEAIVLAANQGTTVVLRRTSRYEILTYEGNVERWAKGVDEKGKVLLPQSRIRFDDDAVARELARGIGVR